MTEPDFPLREHFPDMWNAIAQEWRSNPDDASFPHLSAHARTLLTKFKAIGLMGSIVVFEADSPYTKQEVERKLAEPIKQVLKSKLNLTATLAVSSTKPAEQPASPSPSEDSAADEPSDESSTPSVQHSYRPPAADFNARTTSPSADSELGPERSSRPDRSSGISDAATNPPVTDNQSGNYTARSPRTAAEMSDTEIAVVHPGMAGGVGGHRPQPRIGERPQTAPPSPAQQDFPLNKDYTFDNFVVGSSNNFAAAACRAVAEAPAKAYNPLFIWGESGLGKTHLLHSIGHYAQQLHPNMRVRYISSEELTNDFINSIANDKREAFKRNYRNLDMLIVDDIQFLQGKESTQEEFFHTFNALHQANKQIVLSSDRRPRELTTLEDRLRTRFEGGLITDIQTPDLETRIAILTKKDEAEGVYLPEDVKELIASRYEKSIRELEGARIRITAHCSINKEPITAEVAERVMRDILPEDQDVKIAPQHVIDIVAEYFNITSDDLIGKSRSKRIAQPRKMAMYLCRELTDLSLPKVGESFGNRDHTTVMHAERGIRSAMSEDKQILDQVQTLSQKIKVYARG